MKLNGQLFYVTASFGVIALIRLLSSVVLTRILYPEAYGLVTIVASIVFTIEMLSDLGVATLMVRHEKAEAPEFLSTLWTLRFIRGVINASIVFLVAPLLADAYGTQDLTAPLRFFSIFFLLQGVESMSLLRAVRNHKASKVSIIEVISLAVSTAVSIAISLYSHDHYGMIIGMVVNRGVTAGLSYAIRDPFRPRFMLNREACRELFNISRFVLPSTLVTMALSQYDKVIFLRLFDLTLLGLYGIAGSVIQAVESVIIRITRNILMPQCAEAFRRGRDTVAQVYYRQNIRLHAFILIAPAAVGGGAHFIVETLYDSRYAYAAIILQAFALRSLLLAFYSSAEDLLVSIGYNHITLTGNLLRFAWLIPGTLLGYHFFGFPGFLILAALDHLPSLLYYLWLQKKEGFLVFRYEVYRVALAVVVFLVSIPLGTLGTIAVKALKAAYA